MNYFIIPSVILMFSGVGEFVLAIATSLPTKKAGPAGFLLFPNHDHTLQILDYLHDYPIAEFLERRKNKPCEEQVIFCTCSLPCKET